MQSIKYSRVKLSMYLVLCALFVALGAWAWSNFDGRGAFAGGFVVVAMGCLGLLVLRYILFDNTIVEIGRSELIYHGFLGTKRIRYDQITELSIETTTTNWVFTARHIAIGHQSGGLMNARISEKLLESRFKPLERIIDMMADAREGRQQQDVRPATRREDTAPAQPTMPQPQGFGRKGL